MCVVILIIQDYTCIRTIPRPIRPHSVNKQENTRRDDERRKWLTSLRSHSIYLPRLRP